MTGSDTTRLELVLRMRRQLAKQIEKDSAFDELDMSYTACEAARRLQENELLLELLNAETVRLAEEVAA